MNKSDRSRESYYDRYLSRVNRSCRIYHVLWLQRAVNEMIRTNCKNCGAPLPESNRCEYCGTIEPKERTVRSSVDISENCIRIVCDAPMIGTAVEPYMKPRLLY